MGSAAILFVLLKASATNIIGKAIINRSQTLCIIESVVCIVPFIEQIMVSVMQTITAALLHIAATGSCVCEFFFVLANKKNVIANKVIITPQAFTKVR